MAEGTICEGCFALSVSAAAAAAGSGALVKGESGERAVPWRTALAEASSSVKNAVSSRPAYAA